MEDESIQAGFSADAGEWSPPQLEQMKKIEAALLAQEHRPLKVLWTFFHRKQWPKHDPRRVAARRALFFLWASPSAVAAGSFFALLVSVWGVISQAKIMAEQNRLLGQQVQSSSEQWKVQHRGYLLSILYDKRPCDIPDQVFDVVIPAGTGVIIEQEERDPCAMASARLRAEAAINLHRLEADRLNKECIDSSVQCYPDMSGVDLKYAQLSGSKMSPVNFSDADLSGTVFNLAEIDEAVFERSRLEKAHMVGISAENCEFITARAEGSYFHSADLRDCDFKNSNFSRACLIEADLTDADFVLTAVHGAAFDRAVLTGADLRGAVGLGPEQLAGACSDGGTVLPFSYELPACGQRASRSTRSVEKQAYAECMTRVPKAVP